MPYSGPRVTAGDQQLLDSCARLHLDRAGRRGAYFWLGAAGVAIGETTGVVAGLHEGSSATAAAVAAVGALLGFLVGVKVAHIFYGREELVLYQQVGAALAGSAAALAIAGEPVRPGLDFVILGLGLFLIFGRLGCLHVGCCHGRPAGWGIRYGDDHARAGFPRYYVGVRLFPIQLVAAVAHLVLAGLALAVLLADYPPGEVLCVWLVAYAPVRLLLELARGDDARGFLFDLTQAQWIAVGSSWLAVVLADRWSLELADLYLATAASVTAAAAVIAIAARLGRRGAWGARDVRRIRELGEALAALDRATDQVAVTETPSGLRLSASAEPGGRHFAASRTDGELRPGAARALARQIQAIGGFAEVELIAGKAPGLFHLRARR